MEGYPRVKHHASKEAVLANTPDEEKALGKGWFDHPKDAIAGRVLTNVERGDDNFDPSVKAKQ